MSDIVLVRPGETDFDEQHRIQGTLDLPLNAQGRSQVERLIDELRPLRAIRLYSSPCEPARSTALELGDALRLKVKELDGLRNLDHGLWQGLSLQDLRSKQPKLYRQWVDSPETVCPPAGETVADLIERLRPAMERIQKHDGRVIVVAPEPLAGLLRSLFLEQDLTCPLEQIEHARPGSWELLTTPPVMTAATSAPVNPAPSLEPSLPRLTGSHRWLFTDGWSR